jgi:hypothetical protein
VVWSLVTRRAIAQSALRRLSNSGASAELAAREMEHLHATAALMRSHPEYRAPQRMVETVKTIVNRDLAVFRDKP